MANDDTAQSNLSRSMTLPRLVFYGVGTILGAGIFVVIGEVIGEAGRLAPLSYALAGVVALTTALSYAEISARIPTAGGPIDYVEAASNVRALGSVAGWMLMIANTVSAATITTGFIGYLGTFVEVSDWLVASILVCSLGLLAVLGTKQSAGFMAVTTSIGIITLIAVIWATRDGLAAAPVEITDRLTDWSQPVVVGLLAGAFLAIYSFIGFGDMALVAEEVQDVQKTLPKAIVISLVIVFLFYLAVSMAVIGAGPTRSIAGSDAPLVAAVVREGWPGWPVGIASLFVIVNGALTQIIGASRLLMDIGRDGRGAPQIFGQVHAKTKTPVMATLAVGAAVLILAVAVPLKSLAEATSLVVLLVFFAVTASLVVLKRRDQPADVPNVWIGIPVAGALACLGVALAQIYQWIG